MSGVKFKNEPYPKSPPAVISVGTNVVNTGNLTIPLPATYSNGDLLYLIVRSSGPNTATPTGYTLLPNSVNSGSIIRITGYYKYVTNSDAETAPTITTSASAKQGVILTIRGIATGTPHTGTGQVTALLDANSYKYDTAVLSDFKTIVDQSLVISASATVVVTSTTSSFFIVGSSLVNYSAYSLKNTTIGGSAASGLNVTGGTRPNAGEDTGQASTTVRADTVETTLPAWSLVGTPLAKANTITVSAAFSVAFKPAGT